MIAYSVLYTCVAENLVGVFVDGYYQTKARTDWAASANKSQERMWTLPLCFFFLFRSSLYAEGRRSLLAPTFFIVACLSSSANTPPVFYLSSLWRHLSIVSLVCHVSSSSRFSLPAFRHSGLLHGSHDRSIVACTFVPSSAALVTITWTWKTLADGINLG